MYKVFIYNKPLYFIENENNIDGIKRSSIYSCENIEDRDGILQMHASSSKTNPTYVINASMDKLKEIFFGDYVTVIAAGGLVLNKDNQVLFIFRNGVWDLPKGKVEAGEELNLAALREVEEECGLIGHSIDHKLCETNHTYIAKGKGHYKVTHWYLMKHEGTADLVPQLEEGITQVKWVNIKNIDEYLTNTYGSIEDVVQAFKA